MNITLPNKAATFMANQREQAEALRNQHGIEARPWYRITNAADSDEAEVMLYDEVGGWWGATADEFIADLRNITAPNIRLRVNSPGGSVFEGVAIANALRSHPANVTVQVDGIAASIASVICMAGDRVEMCPNTMLMIHDASGLCIGNAADMAEMEELLSLISDNIADAYVAKAGGTRAEWRARMQAETWYLPDDAVKAGLADEATKTPKSGTPAEEPDEDEPEEGEPEPEMRRSFDPKAYGYQGPQQPEGPKPAPPAAPTPEQVTLTFNLGESFGEKFVEMLRWTATGGKSGAGVEPEAAAEPASEAADAPVLEVADTASPVHHTATEDRPWDAGPNEKRLPSPMTLAAAKKMYAWYDESQVEDGELAKGACKLPHHEVSADGTPGAANLSGVRNALARLPQSDIPASQHDAVRRHLQAHLDDAKQADNRAPASPQNVAQQFQQGDRVRVTVPPHEEGQDVGTVSEINGNAYGITFDGMEDMGVHRWYVDDELEPADGTPDRTPPEAPAAPDDAAPEDAWAAAFARLTEPRPDPWAEAFAHLVNPQPSSSAATAAA